MGVIENSINPCSKLFYKSFMGIKLDAFGVFWSTNNMSKVYIKNDCSKNKKITFYIGMKC
jgi:hypothetical protein